MNQARLFVFPVHKADRSTGINGGCLQAGVLRPSLKLGSDSRYLYI